MKQAAGQRSDDSAPHRLRLGAACGMAEHIRPGVVTLGKVAARLPIPDMACTAAIGATRSSCG